MGNLPGSGRELEGGAHLPGSAGLPPSGTECPPGGLSCTEHKHLVLPAAPCLAFTRTGTREGGLGGTEMVSPKQGEEVSASVCGGRGAGEVCVCWPELEVSSVPFCLLSPFKGGSGHEGWKEKKYI